MATKYDFGLTNGLTLNPYPFVCPTYFVFLERGDHFFFRFSSLSADLPFWQNFTDLEVDEFLAIPTIIHQFHLSSPPPIVESGPLPLSVYPLFPLSSQPLVPITMIFLFPIRCFVFTFAPSKVQAFLWNYAWNRAPTLDIIQSFYPQISLCPNICSLCLSARNPMSTCFFIVLSLGNCGENSFIWSIFVG